MLKKSTSVSVKHRARKKLGYRVQNNLSTVVAARINQGNKQLCDETMNAYWDIFSGFQSTNNSTHIMHNIYNITISNNRATQSDSMQQVQLLNVKAESNCI